MIRLSTLGSLDLRGDDGSVLDTLTSQEKRVALLVYLAVARRGGAVRRDRLLLLFWPELDDRRARDALNQSLHVLRQTLGASCIVSRGMDEVGIDASCLWCDVIAFDAAIDTGRLEEALELYRGDLIDAVHAGASHEFEEWTHGERDRLRARAAQAARTLAERYDREQQYTRAVDYASRALELTQDERALRRLMEVLARAGDRVAAMRAYEAFARRLDAELGLPPSPETRQFADRLRGAEPKFSPLEGPAPPRARPVAGRAGADVVARVDGPSDALHAGVLAPAVVDVAQQTYRQARPLHGAPSPTLHRKGLDGLPHIEGYEVIREIDDGMAAFVYLARERKHPRAVAIKVLKPDHVQSIQAERFLREIEIIAQLSHPHILPLLDSGRMGAVPYYVTPFLADGSLRRRLDLEPGRQLPIGEAMELARQIARALDCAHRDGIVHRDVKPENILMSGGEVQVADFGIARALSLAGDARVTITGTMVGTPAYMSPEQCAGEREVDARSDIYSLGCVLYEMLAGHAPFRGTPTQVIAQHISAPVPSLRDACPLVPFALERVVLRALAKDPEARYATAGELEHAIAEVHDRGSRWLDAWRAVRRKASVRKVAAASILLAMIVGAWRTTWSEPLPDTDAPDPTRIAVLYFDDLSPGGTEGHIAAGLTEDLIDGLSQVGVLRVSSPIAVRQFRAASVSLDSVVKTLGVETLVSGTLVRSDSTLRLTVRLTDALDAHQMESRTFEYPLRDLFALQDELGVEVTEFLRRRIGKEIRLRRQRADARSVFAWELVQRAEELAEHGAVAIREGRSSDASINLMRADTMFARAAAMDEMWPTPLVGRGWAALSLASLSLRPDTGAAQAATTETAKWIQRAISYAEAALRTSTNDENALTLRGAALWHLVALSTGWGRDSLLASVERDLHTALQTRSDFARAWSFLALAYSAQARFGEAADAAVAALEADAFLSNREQILSTLISASLHAERFEEAEHWCRFAQNRHGDDLRFINCELMLIGWRGYRKADIDRAWSLLSSIERDTLPTTTFLWAYRRMLIAAALARAGMTDSARVLLERTRRERTLRPGREDMPIEEAWVLTLLRDYDAAVQRLSTHLERSPDARAHVERSPQFRDLRTHPAFRALVRSPSAPAPRTPARR